MTNQHRATPDQWAYQEHWAVQDGDAACILELRARIEILEKRCEVQLMQLGDLQSRFHRLALQVAHLERETCTDRAEQHCVKTLTSVPEPISNS